MKPFDSYPYSLERLDIWWDRGPMAMPHWWPFVASLTLSPMLFRVTSTLLYLELGIGMEPCVTGRLTVARAKDHSSLYSSYQTLMTTMCWMWCHLFHRQPSKCYWLCAPTDDSIELLWELESKVVVDTLHPEESETGKTPICTCFGLFREEGKGRTQPIYQDQDFYWCQGTSAFDESFSEAVHLGRAILWSQNLTMKGLPIDCIWYRLSWLSYNLNETNSGPIICCSRGWRSA